MHDKIREFIFENFLFDSDGKELDNDASFLETGIIDSTGMLELVSWVQETYGFEIEDTELVPDNLDSVNRLAMFIGKKLNAEGQSA